MPRGRRTSVLCYPHHIFHQSHSGRALFQEASDFIRFLNSIKELKQELGIQVHAYCLLPWQIRLLVTPMNTVDSLSRMLRELCAQATRDRNHKDRTSGTAWNGRFRCSLVDPSTWLLPCQRQIELLPVLQELAPSPQRYPWSSYQMHMGEAGHSWLDLPPQYLALGANEEERRTHYRAYLQEKVPDDERTLIETAIRRNQLTGGEAFTDEIERITGVRVSSRGPGRPRKYPKE